jgi:hypothetical protein
MKKILLLMVLILTLFQGPTSIKGNDIPGLSAGSVEGISDVDGMEYTEDLTITFTEESATLNGEPFLSGTIVNEVGNYDLVLFDGGVEVDSITFTILPRFLHPLVDEMSVYRSYFITLENVGSLLINGEAVEEGDWIEYAGNHVITVEGVNGFVQTYNIIIKDQLMEYLKEHQIYNDFTIDISKYAEVYYNDELLVEDITFTEIGYYVLDLVYHDNTEESVFITYGHTTNRFENHGVYPNSLLLQKDSALKWYIDNTEQKQGIDSLFITKVGVHTIIFLGNNGYEKIYQVTITEGDIGITDGQVFEDYFKFQYTGYTVSLNGIRYSSNSEKSGAGYYTMKIKGVNGYTNEYEIFINETVPFEEMSNFESPQEITESITLDQDFSKIYVNGKEVENFRFTKSGEYRVVYQGAGGYLDAYTVIYTNQHVNVNNLLFQGVMGLTALVVMTYIFLAWRRFK